jgi:hypothetical protein
MLANELLKECPEAAIEFETIWGSLPEGHAKNQKRSSFWHGWSSKDKLSGHFSQDEIDWMEDLSAGADPLEDLDTLRGIISEMEKSQHG